MESGLLITAAVLCGCTGFITLGLRTSKTAFALNRGVWLAVAALTLAAVGFMLHHLLTNRFEYSYVAQHSAKAQAAVYKVSALWAGQEGSFLLWSAVLSVTGLPLSWRKDRQSSKVFGVYTLICMCIFVMTIVSDPFARIYIASVDGVGMTDALKSPWMVAHPPLVFAAYSAMAVLAAYAVVPEQKGDLLHKAQWWVRFSWVMLGLGIFTGSIWAYNALGWGGYWAWDPIENAALVPWLVLCGYLHTRETCTRVRCALPFALACFGTFLTRSGILGDTSAHAYTQGETAVSVIIIAMLMGVSGWIGFALVLRKKSTAKKSNPFDNQRLFASLSYITAALVFVGTIAPIITGFPTPTVAFSIVAIVFALTNTALLILQDKQALKRHSFAMMGLSTAIVIGTAFALTAVTLWMLLLLWVCMMPICLWTVSGFKEQNWRYYSNHIGMVLMTVGVIYSLGLGREGIALIPLGSARTIVAGISVPVSSVLTEDVTILSSTLTDVIVQGGNAMMLYDGSVVVSYIMRPMICLFWIGGFLTILSPLFFAMMRSGLVSTIRRRFSNSEQQTQAELGGQFGKPVP